MKIVVIVLSLSLLAATPNVTHHVYTPPCMQTFKAYYARESRDGFSRGAADIHRDSRNTHALLDIKFAVEHLEKAPIDPRDRHLAAVVKQHITDAREALLSVAGPNAQQMYNDLTPCLQKDPDLRLFDVHQALVIATVVLEPETKARPSVAALKHAVNNLNAALAILPNRPGDTRLHSPGS